MNVNEPYGGIYAVAAATTTAAAATTTISTTKAPTTTTTTTKAPTSTTAPSPVPTTTTTSVPTAVITSSSVVSSLITSVSSSVPITTSSLPITTSSSILPSSTSIMPVSTSSAIASVTPTTVTSSSNSSHTNLIGPIVGSVGGAAVLLGVGILFYRRRRSKREENDADRTFSDYLATSDAAMRGGGKQPQWTGDNDYTGRNSTLMRSPASIAAGMYQQPSPRMMPAVGNLAATQGTWRSSGSPSPEHTMVGSPEQQQRALYAGSPTIGAHNRYSGNYSNSQYYQQPEYPAGQAYYPYAPEQYDQYDQYDPGYQPYFDPATEQYVYPANVGYEPPDVAGGYSENQPPHTYDTSQQMTEQQRDYSNSPLPALPQANTLSIVSTDDEPRFPPHSPPMQNASVGESSRPTTLGDRNRTRTPDVSSADQTPSSN